MGPRVRLAHLPDRAGRPGLVAIRVDLPVLDGGRSRLCLSQFTLLPRAADPALWPGATDELLRYTPSIVTWRRKALADTEIDGVKIPAGSDLLLLLASGNRDEAVFPQGDQLDITRANARNHLSLGFGIHYCLGQQLAKMEFGIAMKELGHRLPSLRLAPGQTPAFAHNASFRVPQALLLEWDM